MKERLVSFLLFGILFALGYRLALDLIYGHFFATSLSFQTFWYVPYAAVPALLLFGLAVWLGFYRKLGLADLAVTLILLGIVGLTVPASYTCGLTRFGCF